MFPVDIGGGWEGLGDCQEPLWGVHCPASSGGQISEIRSTTHLPTMVLNSGRSWTLFESHFPLKAQIKNVG